jgi:hypothetical protein
VKKGKNVRFTKKKFGRIDSRALKLKFIGGPHSKEKMLRGLQFNRKKAFAGCSLQEKPLK